MLKTNEKVPVYFCCEKQIEFKLKTCSFLNEEFIN